MFFFFFARKKLFIYFFFPRIAASRCLIHKLQITLSALCKFQNCYLHQILGHHNFNMLVASLHVIVSRTHNSFNKIHSNIKKNWLFLSNPKNLGCDKIKISDGVSIFYVGLMDIELVFKNIYLCCMHMELRIFCMDKTKI